MYLAKSRGRGQSALFEPAMHAVAVTRLELQSDLRHAVERGELMVVYQPIHALETQALVGVEALLRWTHAGRGPIAADCRSFRSRKRAALITPIGRWVLEQACRDAQGWRTRDPRAVAPDGGGEPVGPPDSRAEPAARRRSARWTRPGCRPRRWSSS